MSLRKLHQDHLNMQQSLDRDLTATAEAKATLRRVIRSRWEQATNSLFEQIPLSLMPFISELAWNVFDSKQPGPLEEFVVALVMSSPIKGHSIHIKADRLSACGASDINAFLILMIQLNAAWKEVGINLLVEPEEGGVKVIFFAI